MFAKKITATVSLFVLLHSNSWANNCEMLIQSLNESGANFNHAIKNQDIENVRFYVHQARKSLNNATIAAMNCGCNFTYVELSNALVSIDRAEDSDDLEEMNSNIDHAIRSFNNATTVMDCCR